MTSGNPSPSLYNEDLAPARERKWGAFSIYNVWTSDVHSLWGYYLAASLFLLCGNFINFVLAIGLGSLVIFFLMNLVGYAGVKTGVPSPVLARASFGIWGANVPALVRAIVACFWYGAQTAAASGAIVSLLTRSESMMQFQQSSHMLGHSTLEVICFVVVWALQLLIIQNGMETVRKFQDWAGPAVWVMMLILAIGLCVKAGGFSFSHQIPMDVLLAKTKDAGVAHQVHQQEDDQRADADGEQEVDEAAAQQEQARREVVAPQAVHVRGPDVEDAESAPFALGSWGEVFIEQRRRCVRNGHGSVLPLDAPRDRACSMAPSP
jgi:cytosine/uracil/thiamine/allantoin permease